MRKIRIAQIGVGHDHASSIFATLCKLKEDFEVVGYAKVPEDNLDSEWTKKQFNSLPRAYQGYKEYTVEEILAMPDLDAVAIETYDLNLVKYAQMAADRGLHIHMDKAPGERAEAFERLLSTVRKKKLAFNIGYMYRFNPFVKQVFAERNDYGRIYCIDAEMSCFYPKDKRDWLGYFQGGMMQYLGCHLVDLAVRLMGVPENIVPTNISTGYQGTTAKDCCLALFQYKDGVATLKSSMGEYGGFSRRRCIVSGEKRTFEIRPIETDAVAPKDNNSLSSRATDFTSEAWGDKGAVINSDDFDRYEAMMQAFAQSVRGERGYEVDLQTEARVHRCLLAACGIPCDFKAEIHL